MKFHRLAALAALGLAAGAAQAKDSFCIEHRYLTVGGVEFMGPSAAIFTRFGKPASTRRWYRASDGNEGSYHMKDFNYPGIAFSVRDGKGEYDRVQRVLITAARAEVPAPFIPGATRDEVLRRLGFDARRHLPPEGRDWSIPECESEGINFVDFGFDAKGRLKKVDIQYDSDSI